MKVYKAGERGGEWGGCGEVYFKWSGQQRPFRGDIWAEKEMKMENEPRGDLGKDSYALSWVSWREEGIWVLAGQER